MSAASEKKRILVVDDDPSVVAYLLEMLGEAGYTAQGVHSGPAAIEHLERESCDLVITDLEMPAMRGQDLLAAIHARWPAQLVLMITAFGSIDLAVQAVRAGACDFVAKPFRDEVLLLAIERALRERQMRREIVRLRASLSGKAPQELVANSRAMRQVVELARRAAATDATVLLTGESGTGKGAIAQFIHGQGPRAGGPFVQVNCAALPLQLVESELFGVRKGAFTDARADRSGLFLEATGGTLFLDEIAEMPLETQPKLLQVLETGRVRPLGGGSEVAVDVRCIAATNRPLEMALRDRRFRPDLYYRLNVIRIEIPPLHQRPEDIEALVDVFLSRASAQFDRPLIGISADAMRWLISHHWPGNVRELSNVIERAVALADHDTILLEDLRQATSTDGAGADLLAEAAACNLPLAAVEQAYIRRVLKAVGGNKVHAARVLDIDRRTLYRKLEQPEPEGNDPVSS
jgi:DNA-binding NtrC family response regulator